VKISLFILFVVFLPVLSTAGSVQAQCTGLPDLGLSIVTQTYPGQATLLVIPDGSGPPLTAARTAAGTTVDATIHLTLIAYCEGEDPVVGFPMEDMWLESVGGGLVICMGGTTADAATDQNGHTQWSQAMEAGGWDEGPSRVSVNGSPLSGTQDLTLDFNSPDINGDLAVNLSDVALFSQDFWGGFSFRADLWRDGSLNLSDVGALANSVGATCP